MGVNNVAPSKNRDPSGLLYMAATGTQPSGRALPPLLPDRIPTMQDHINFAIYLNPHRDMLYKAVPPFARAIAKDLRNDPDCVNEKRKASLAYMGKLKATLAESNTRWTNHLPADNPSRKIDFALIHFLVSNLRYPDASLAKDLTKGMPLVGEVPPTGVFSKRVREQVLSAPQWKEDLVERNKAMVHRVTHPSDRELARLC